MPQTDFYFSELDLTKLVDLVFSLGGVVVPDIHYPEAVHIEIGDLAQFARARASTNLFFVLFPGYHRSALEMRKLEKGANEGRFVILQRSGGPTIDIFVPRAYHANGLVVIPSGLIGYQRTYWDTQAARNCAAPAELKSIYLELVKHVRSTGESVRLGSRVYWVGSDAMKQRAGGAVFKGMDLM